MCVNLTLCFMIPIGMQWTKSHSVEFTVNFHLMIDWLIDFFLILGRNWEIQIVTCRTRKYKGCVRYEERRNQTTEKRTDGIQVRGKTFVWFSPFFAWMVNYLRYTVNHNAVSYCPSNQNHLINHYMIGLCGACVLIGQMESHLRIMH